jgi:hypothetical protein
LGNPGAAHGLDDLLSEERAFAKIDVGFGGGARDIGIRSQVNHDLMLRHDTLERG